MLAGRGKAKGSQFERLVCKELSLWVTGRKRDDVFWRSAMSGGRATLRRGQGKEARHQAGDISAVHESGYAFTNYWYIECKFVKDLRLGSFILENVGLLAGFWKVAVEDARHHQRYPMLIAKQNFGRTFVLIPESERVKFAWARNSMLAIVCNEIEQAALLSFDAMVASKVEVRTIQQFQKIERIRLDD